ncbi:MAG: type II toxin-antitoxin system HicA family toxin [Planctomycetaceae bacterium]|nr:type II toxin-antitoxin system HicA family toxin [Planctomycetaceae bacterium]
MKRRQLEKHLRDHGCVLHHHGGNHDIWINLKSLSRSPVPRHPTLKKGTAKGICRMLGVPVPAGC